MTGPTGDPGDGLTQLREFARRHKVALIVGGVLLLLVSMADNQEGAGGSDAPIASGGGGGFDKRQWDADQRRDDDMQRDRVDGIREVERCMDDDGRVYEAPIGTCS